MPASKTVFIQHSCFGYFDEKFDECARKCRVSHACKSACESPEAEEIRAVYKYKHSQIDEMVEKYGGVNDGKV